MRALFANVHFTLRLVRRSPGFYALILALLTAGIGATTAMFSVAESVLLEPLPYPDPEDLTEVDRFELGERTSVSAANFLDWRAQGTTFEQMAAVATGRMSLSSEGTLPVSVEAAEVTGDFFPMFRLKPLLGRFFGPDDDRPGAPLVCVIGAELWKTQFASDPGIVGRTITLNSRPYTIVGVAPRGFSFASSNDRHVAMWKPYFGKQTAEQYVQEIDGARGLNTLAVTGRRRHGVSLAEAQAQMTAVAKNLEVAYPAYDAKTGVVLRDLHDALVGDRSHSIWMLLADVLLVFVVISANVASLILARAQVRRGELVTRAALGASSSALVLQLVTETLVLFGLGSLLGSAVAWALVDTLASHLFGRTSIEGALTVRTDLAALGAGVATSLLFGLAAGVGPALVTARVDPAIVLKQTSVRAGVHRSQAAVRALLVVTQLAVAFALLTGSVLTVKAFVRLLSTPPGFDGRDVATAVVDLPNRKYGSEDKVRDFSRRALRAMGDLPGVESVALTTSLPMSNSSQGLTFSIEGRPPFPQGDAPPLGINFVSPGYFATMRIPILQGRAFTAEDTEASRPVMLISKKAADRHFPGENPIGQRIEYGDGVWREILGVVGDVRKEGLGLEPSREGYTPFAQTPDGRIFFAVRTKTPEAVLAALPRLVQSLDPELAVSELETMEARTAGTASESRDMAFLLGAFALAALVLATLGLFGLVSYTTAERTRELGIRLALGSPPEAVVGLVIRSAMKLVLVGLGIGAVLSVWVARQVAAIVPGATAFDPAVVAPIPLVLGVAGLVASLLPALRAVRTPPASALRYE
jgi:putative ABC transport system permease protein